jgi:hypothetical protein
MEAIWRAYRQWWSPEIRLKDMDGYGWDIQVLLPTGNNGNFAYRVALKDVQLGAAMCRAYNNWCHEYCSVDPKRLKFVAVLPGSEVGEMVKEARRAVKTGRGISRNLFFQWANGSMGQSTTRYGTSPAGGFPYLRSWRISPTAISSFRQLAGERREDIQLALRGLDHALLTCDNMTTLDYIFTGMWSASRLQLGILESTPVGCLSGSEEWMTTPRAQQRDENQAADARGVLHASMHYCVRQR